MAPCRGPWLQPQLYTPEKNLDTHLTKPNLSSAAFADDLLCPTGMVKDLKAQAHKLTLYSDWAAPIISGSKTKVTGILHSLPTKGKSRTTPPQVLRHQLKNYKVEPKGFILSFKHTLPLFKC